MRPQIDTVDRKIARMASRAWGVVTHQELLHAGVSVREIRTRRERGSLIEVHRGVYRVGHAAPTTEATYMAAVKACGDGAVISGKAAAQLHGLIRLNPPPAPETTTPNGRHPSGVVVHRSRARLPAVRVRGIPTTTVPRTLVDLAAVLTEDELGRAVHEAMVKHGTKPRHIEAVLRANAPGAANLRRILNGDSHIKLSHLEKAFLDLLRKHGLPLPETNKRQGTFFVDCRWPEQHLTVELDSYRYHHSRHAWERDRQREREARARGDDFRRYTYGDITETPDVVIGELASLL